MQIPETEIIISKEGAQLLLKTVRPGEYVVGREPACDLHLDDESLSPRHALITVNYDHALVEDLGSESGTFVNGKPVKDATRLFPNQKIQVGGATIELHRVKSFPPPDVTVAPSTAVLNRLLPEELLRERKYEIGGEVARGGMGAILDARDSTTERRVAMKVVLDGSSPDVVARFIAEAKITAQLEHPSIVPVYELSKDENGDPFYTMKMVRGITLRKVIEPLAARDAEAAKKYPLPALLTIFQKVCDALAFAHAKTVLHRDLKPENIMLDDFGVVLVMDWGLAKVIGQKQGPAPTVDLSRSVVRTVVPTGHGTTLDGIVLGTPQYMSPEQARGEIETLDARSDIYSLGAILYHILALRPSLTGKEVEEVVRQVAAGKLDPLTPAFKDRPVPDSLAAVTRKAMALEPANRYQRVTELQRDIEAYQTGFATGAENATAWKQLTLFIKRNKGIVATAAAAWGVITLLAVWFVINVTRARNLAIDEQHRAEQATAWLGADKVETLLRAGKTVEAVPYLAKALRENPNDASAAERLISALTWRTFALPITPTLAHGSRFHSIAFSHDGQRLLTSAAARMDTRAVIWDARTGRKLVTSMFADQGMHITALWSPNERRVLTVTDRPDGRWEAVEWDAAKGERIEPPMVHDGEAASFDYAPNGRFIATAQLNHGGQVFLWDAQTHLLRRTIPTDGKGVKDLKVSPDSKTIVATDEDGNVRLWSVEDGQPVGAPFQFGNKARFLGFSPDAQRLVVGATDGSTNVFEAHSGRPLNKPLLNHSGLRAASFFAGGSRILTHNNGAATVWDSFTWESIGAPITKHSNWIYQAIASPDGCRVATASIDGEAKVWDAHTGSQLCEPMRHLDAIRCIAFSDDGARLATAADDRTARVWDIRPGAALPVELRGDSGQVLALEFSSYNGRLYAAQGSKIFAWDPKTGAMDGPPLATEKPVRFLRLSADGRKLLALINGNQVKVWDLESRALIRTLSPPGGDLFTAELSPDGTLVATSTRDQFVRLWRTTGGELAAERKQDGQPPLLRFAPDGQRLFVLSAEHYNGQYEDIKSLTFMVHRGVNLIGDWPLQVNGGGDTAFSHTGDRLVGGGADGMARIWDGHDGKPFSSPMHHRSTIVRVLFSPDDRRVLTASLDGTACIWNAEKETAEPMVEPMSHPSDVLWAEFSPDGRRVLTACKDGYARIWDAAVGQPLGEPLHHGDGLAFAHFSPDGHWVASAGKDGVVRLWEAEQPPTPVPPWLPELAEALLNSRLNTTGIHEPANADAVLALKPKLDADAGTDYYTRWGRWFFADRSTRTISPSAAVRVPQQVERWLATGRMEDARAAVLAAPGDPHALARLAQVEVSAGAKTPKRDWVEARHLSEMAAGLAPDDAAIRKIRDQIAASQPREAAQPATPPAH